MSVTDTAAAPDAAARVRALLATPDFGGRRHASRVIVRQVAFSYTQLVDWRDQVLDSLFFTGDGIVLLDLDEEANALYIGVDAATFPGREATLRADLLRMGIPRAAVRLAPRTRSSGVSGEVWATQLLASSQPFYAGLRVMAMETNNAGPCTGGVIADYGGSRVLVLASHCSKQWAQGGSDGTVFADLYDKTLGTELLDPGASTCNGWPCRQSEIALAQLTGPASGYLRGAVARPAVLNSCTWGQDPLTYCNTYTNATYPIFLVREQSSSTYVGMPVEKVGVKTGWTSGQISRTCAFTAVRFNGVNTYLKCAQETTAYASGGDSGGPFISRAGDDGSVTFLGITSSADIDARTSTYTTLASFAADAGISPSAINVTTSTAISGVQISGDNVLNVSWTAAAVSGSTPYPTVYTLYRKYHQADGDGPLVARFTTTTAGSVSEDDCVSVDYYYGTTVPPTNVSWVGYFVGAQNTLAAGTNSPTIYYRVIEPPSC